MGRQPATPGALVISLDFELYWGVRDHATIDDYRENLLGVRTVLPAMLELFERRDIAATWATVGMLMATHRDELERFAPTVRPTYGDPRLDPYVELGRMGADEQEDPFRYAPSLVAKIVRTPRQEVATHTFSHLYALQASDEAFADDLEAARAIARARGIEIKSIVFPRNEVSAPALVRCRARGLESYRGTGTQWYQSPGNTTPPARACRLLDAYVPLKFRAAAQPGRPDAPVDVPASLFLRPCSGRPRGVPAERWRLRRITAEMTTAARRGQVFHLWWHPHNFGRAPDANLAFLRRILDHFSTLRRYGMRSLTMLEAARERA